MRRLLFAIGIGLIGVLGLSLALLGVYAILLLYIWAAGTVNPVFIALPLAVFGVIAYIAWIEYEDDPARGRYD